MPASTVRIYFEGERTGPLFRRATARAGEQVRTAVNLTAVQAATEIVDRGRADIAGADGHFGERWPRGLHAEVRRGGGSVRIDVFHDISYYMVHERGALIHGKPLLWIPLDFAADAKGIRARDYPGRLFRVDRPGKAPLLLTTQGRGKRAVALPKYFGKESVRIPKRFHVTEIARDVAHRLAAMFKKNRR